VGGSGNRRISIHNPQGEVIFYDGPENDYGIYSRYQTTMGKKSIIQTGKGKKHIDFFKEDDLYFKKGSQSSKKNNTRKYNSKHTNVNMGITMDNINELDEESDIEESCEKDGKAEEVITGRISKRPPEPKK
jgi:hypothetical protein